MIGDMIMTDMGIVKQKNIGAG